MTPKPYNMITAIQDFQTAQQRAAVQEVLARLTGRSNELLSYEDVAEKLKLRVRMDRGIQQIPMDSIVGSVGRYTEFTRTFLPRRMGNRERWARVKAALMESGAGLPPIEVYKVGDVYFVIDGNHRVSIAREEGATDIEARVIELQTDIKLTPDVEPDDLIVKAEYVEFMNLTKISELRPNVDLTVTTCGQYEKILKYICTHETVLEHERKDSVGFQEAVLDWYDNEYVPLAEVISERGLLHWFPERTITDLYIWISENRTALEEDLGWDIQSNVAATDLILERSAQTEPGSWRKSRLVSRYVDRLFADILVPLSGDPESWDSLEQALIIARRDGAAIHGLHIVDSKEKTGSPEVLSVREQFEQLCIDAGIKGKLFIEAGDITKRICQRATFTDLIVLKIVHPPMGGLSNLKSPFRSIITHSSRPILGVPQKAAQFDHALLAFDGSKRAREALFVATYLAEMWKTRLTVFTALDGGAKAVEAQEYARKYLDIHEVEADYLISKKGATDELKRTVEERFASLVLMGSHGGNVLEQVIIGSALDYMLRESRVPIFICR